MRPWQARPARSTTARCEERLAGRCVPIARSAADHLNEEFSRRDLIQAFTAAEEAEADAYAIATDGTIEQLRKLTVNPSLAEALPTLRAARTAARKARRSAG